MYNSICSIRHSDKQANTACYRLLFLIIILIGFQQFPVLRIGGSLKIYELLALIVLFRYRHHWIWDKTTYALWGLFILSPIISYINSLLFVPIPANFYIHYPKAAGSFKFDSLFFPILQQVYMFFCFVVLACIYQKRKLYENFHKICKWIILLGTGIAIYSLFAMFVYDPIVDLPSFMHNKSECGFRSSGLSQEPSNYVLYQGWVVLFVYAMKHAFTRQKWYLLLTINILSLVLTFSTAMISYIGVILLSFFVCKETFRKRLFLLLGFAIIMLTVYIWLQQSGLYNTFESLFINKATHFFSPSDNTLDSGSFRNYTNRIGWKIFEDYPLLGVGVGRSVFYMHLYEFKMDIVHWGETLKLGIFPQNMFACVFAEQGILGGGALVLITLFTIQSLWRFRNVKPFGRIFFIGGLFNLSTMLSNAVVYSLYSWVFLFLVLGYIRYKNQEIISRQ